jgi:hypothetical protein
MIDSENLNELGLTRLHPVSVHVARVPPRVIPEDKKHYFMPQLKCPHHETEGEYSDDPRGFIELSEINAGFSDSAESATDDPLQSRRMTRDDKRAKTCLTFHFSSSSVWRKEDAPVALTGAFLHFVREDWVQSLRRTTVPAISCLRPRRESGGWEEETKSARKKEERLLGAALLKQRSHPAGDASPQSQ